MSIGRSIGLMLMSTFILIPGAGGAAWFWHRVDPELRARGHDAIAVDLPADDESAGLERYAETVVIAIGDRDDVVLVAQSMGGFTAPLVTDRVPVRLIVLLNAMIPLPGETGGEWWAATGQEAAMRDNAVRIGLEPQALDDPAVLFGHDVPPDIFSDEPNHMREQSWRPFEDPWPMSTWPSVPTVVLAARDDRLFPLDFQRRVARERLGLEVEEMEGSHSVALSRPGDLADRLVECLETPVPTLTKERT